MDRTDRLYELLVRYFYVGKIRGSYGPLIVKLLTQLAEVDPRYMVVEKLEVTA